MKIKTINHRDTETQRNSFNRFSQCLCVSVAKGVSND